MRRLIFTFFVLQLLILPLHAQRGRLRVPAATRANKVVLSKVKLSSRQITAILNKRLHTSFLSATSLQTQFTGPRSLPIGEPIRSTLRPKDMSTLQIYPDKPFLTTREQVAAYMAARSNRLFNRELQRMQSVWAQIDAQLPALQAIARGTPQVEKPILWATTQLPPSTSILFVGEIHGYPEIHESVTELLYALRRQLPSREILLLTEFLPEHFEWTTQTDPQTADLTQFTEVWAHALNNHIKVIGLEPPFILKNKCEVSVSTQTGKIRQIDQWAQLEGIRLRNERWLTTIQQYRQQYPHALFVVYTGAGHSLYNSPFSLGNMFPAEKVFVMALYPTKYFFLEDTGFLKPAKEQETTFKGPLERLTEQVQFPQTILHFNDPALTKLVGFDIRIRVPVHIERHLF